MDTFTLNEMKYRAMEKATTVQGRILAHDAGNVAMNVVMSEYGAVKMISRCQPSKN